MGRDQSGSNYLLRHVDHSKHRFDFQKGKQMHLRVSVSNTDSSESDALSPGPHSSEERGGADGLSGLQQQRQRQRQLGALFIDGPHRAWAVTRHAHPLTTGLD